jgi:hypothetical protein
MEASERTNIRNQLLASKLEVLSKGSFAPPARAFVQLPAAPAGSGSFIWVLEHDGVPAHWERARADGQDPNRRDVASSDSIFKIVAVKCRRIPRRPPAPTGTSAPITADAGAMSEKPRSDDNTASTGPKDGGGDSAATESQ